MALTRIGADFTTLFARSTYAGKYPQKLEQIHASVVRRYPEAPQLPLPTNVSEIFNMETCRFGPERTRDIAAPVFLYGQNLGDNNPKLHQLDARVESYDCFGAVSLNSSMQTNVPKPFCAHGKSNYLNMPGGLWSRDGKYLAEDMRKSLIGVYQLRHASRSGAFNGLVNSLTLDVIRQYSTDTEGDSKKENLSATEEKRRRLRILVRDYGRTIIGFHIFISLISLGIFYALVSSGVDMTKVITMFSKLVIVEDKEGNSLLKEDEVVSEELSEDSGIEKPPKEDPLVKVIMSEGSTFLIAYAIHKLFAPIRLSMTLGCAPILVRFLRRKGILKPPKPKMDMY